MPKLLQINSVVNTGSTGRIVEQLGQLAMANGVESYIAFGREARKSRSKLIRIGSKAGVYLHAIVSKYCDNQGLMSKCATRRFLKRLDEIKPDVVHLHNIHGYYINYPLLFSYLKAKDIPTVITMHDFWLMTGHCAYINKTCDRWKIGCGKCSRLDQYPAAKIDASARNWTIKAKFFADMPNVTLVPVSYWLERYAEESLLHFVKHLVIYNGVDTEVFKPYDKPETSVEGIDWSKFSIMVIATRWTAANGYQDVLRLSQILPADCQIIMIGLDEEQIKSLPNNIVGFKKTESFVQLQELYSKSDVIFNPNTEVTFGLVTVEAMSCGTPAIVLRDTAGEELVDEHTGFVVDKTEDVVQLIPIIKNLNKKQTAETCRRRAQTLYDAKKQYQKYIDLYNKLINK